jgi:large subunit ribosomal protein L3
MIISTKIGQTSFVNENGTRVSATVLDYNSCTVVGNRTINRDGYLANIIGFLKPKKLNKPQLKEFNKLNLEPKKIIREQRINSDEELLEVGSLIDPKFKVGDKVSVQSKSTGKGFAGAMKRHNFSGMRATHGVSISHRAHGSTGQNQDPGKVFKGKKMAGHMGDKIRSIQNMEIIKTDEDNELIYLKGSIPGSKNSEVLLKSAIKNINKMTIAEKIENLEKLKKGKEKKK